MSAHPVRQNSWSCSLSDILQGHLPNPTSPGFISLDQARTPKDLAVIAVKQDKVDENKVENGECVGPVLGPRAPRVEGPARLDELRLQD